MGCVGQSFNDLPPPTHTHPFPPRFPYGLTGCASERTDPPPGRGALAASFCPERFRSIFFYQEREREGGRHTEVERARKNWEKSSESRSRKKNGISTQTALMAGIWFAATFLVCGISTSVSSARIYPPNEGKAVGRAEVARAPGFIPSAPLRASVCDPAARAPTLSLWEHCHVAVVGGAVHTHFETGVRVRTSSLGVTARGSDVGWSRSSSPETHLRSDLGKSPARSDGKTICDFYISNSIEGLRENSGSSLLTRLRISNCDCSSCAGQ